ncbi:hypothetical protein KPL74_08940 [Bacillus sp. NP157]|nr:hypothetical protein KPL74_08940 [Bacillus sp. NP157]
MKGTPAFVRATVSVACALMMTTPASPADAGETSMAQTARAAAAAYFHQHLPTAQGQFRNCVGVQPPNPGYENRGVLRCDDSRLGLPAVIYLLNPSADNLADRVGHACEAVGLAGSPGCGERLAKHIIGQNGGQFPVAGQVIETGAEMHKGGTIFRSMRSSAMASPSRRVSGSPGRVRRRAPKTSSVP